MNINDLFLILGLLILNALPGAQAAQYEHLGCFLLSYEQCNPTPPTKSHTLHTVTASDLVFAIPAPGNAPEFGPSIPDRYRTSPPETSSSPNPTPPGITF